MERKLYSKNIIKILSGILAVFTVIFSCLSVYPAAAAAEEEIVMTIEFGPEYGNRGSGNPLWYYLTDEPEYCPYTIQNNGSDFVLRVADSNFNDAHRYFLLSNDRSIDTVDAGKNYWIEFEVTLGNDKPISSAAVSFRFGDNIWTDLGHEVDYSSIEQYVKSSTVLSDGSVRYWLRVPLSVPEIDFQNQKKNILMRFYRNNNDTSYAYIDDVKIIARNTVDVLVHNYDGCDKTVEFPEAMTFGEVAVPLRSGYDFCGFYLDSSKTQSADSALTTQTSEVWAKWEAKEMPDCFINNYDDDAVYSVNEGKDLTRNGLTIGNTDAVSLGETTDEYGNSTKAAKISKIRQWKYNWPAAIRIFGSDNNFAETKAGATYTVSLKYKITDWKLTASNGMEIILRKSGVNNCEGGVTAIKLTGDNHLSKNTERNTWITLSGEFTATQDNQPLWITVTRDVNAENDNIPWEEYADIYIDDIVIKEKTPILENYVHGDLNDDGEANLLDFIIIKKMMGGIKPFTIAADIDCNNEAEAEDMAILKKKLLGENDYPEMTKGNRKLTWSDEFDSHSLDTDKWQFSRKMSNSDAIYNNSETNTNVSEGSLNMKVHKAGNNKFSLSETLTTQGKMQFKYGYLEIRAKFPFSKGSWAALWMKSDTSRATLEDHFGEIDIVEAYGQKINTQLWKWPKVNGNSSNRLGLDNAPVFVLKDHPDFDENEWHVYGFEWTDEFLKFYVDGEKYGEVDIAKTNLSDVANEWYYIIFSNEIFTESLDWHPEGEILTYDDAMPELKVDYIRLYQDASSGEVIEIF